MENLSFALVKDGLNNMKIIKLTEDQIDLLKMGLRYLELNHKGIRPGGKPIDYKPDFRKLLNKISKQTI